MNFTPSFIKTKEKVGNPIDDARYEPIMKYVVTDMATFRPHQTVNEIIDIMVRHKISWAPVVNADRELLGIVSEKDCLQLMLDCAYHNQPLSGKTVEECMTMDTYVIPVNQDIMYVARAFVNTNFRRFPVVDGKKLIGQISRKDILKAVKRINCTTW